VRYKKNQFFIFTDPPLDFKTSGKKTCILVSEITNLASLSVTLPLLFDTILTDLIYDLRQNLSSSTISTSGQGHNSITT
jgi:hypothetical protein